MDNAGWKWLLIIICVLYVLSPIDAVPGPVDDIIVMIVTALVDKRIAARDE